MSNLKKITLVIMFMFLLSGCDVTYNLKIGEDLKVKEEIKALEKKEYNDLAHDFLLDRISVSFSSRYEEIYDYSAISEDTKIGNKVVRNYSSLSEYKSESNIFKDLVKNYFITETPDIVNLKVTLSDSIYDPNDIAYIIIPENVSINIDLPFKVTNSNADSNKGNIYTWKIDQNKRNVDIILSFDKNRLSNQIYVLNIGIRYDILLVVGIIISVSIIALIVFKKVRGINKV